MAKYHNCFAGLTYRHLFRYRVIVGVGWELTKQKTWKLLNKAWVPTYWHLHGHLCHTCVMLLGFRCITCVLYVYYTCMATYVLYLYIYICITCVKCIKYKCSTHLLQVWVTYVIQKAHVLHVYYTNVHVTHVWHMCIIQTLMPHFPVIWYSVISYEKYTYS